MLTPAQLDLLRWRGRDSLAACGLFLATAALARDSARRARTAAAQARLDVLAHLPPAPPAPEPTNPHITLAGHTLAPGARIAITGTSGSGKTLALETLAGVRTATLAATIAGAPPAQTHAATLNALFALSPQPAPTIAGTIADNLRLARPAVDEAAMWAALDVACLAARVQTLPDKLETWLGDGGAPLSGGERKRLSLARALLAGRPWLLLDEPSEGLDPATEADVIARLAQWLAATHTGLILVSHRPAPLALTTRRIAVADLTPRPA